MSLKDKIGSSIINMSVQRGLDFATMLIVTTLIVRSLPREEYGKFSLIIGYGLVFNFFNVAISSILIRDFPKVRTRINEYMNAFILFSFMKSIVVLLLTLFIGYFLYRRYEDSALLTVLALSSLNFIILYVVDPASVLLSVDFRQGILTWINLVSGVANIVISLGVFWMPTAVFVSIKNVLVTLIILFLTYGYAIKIFQLKYALNLRAGFRLTKECLVGFSLWSHLMGTFTDIIYRADLLILGWLNPPFQVVGNYNISLQMSNFTKLMPQILQYNTTLGLSHSVQMHRREELTFLFIKYSFLLSFLTMSAYIVLGRLAIRIIAGSDVEEIYQFGLYMIAGLCIFNTFRPLISYGMVVHDIRACFCYAIIPSTIGTLACYIGMGVLWGASGLAKANLAGGIMMTLFTLAYIHFKTNFRWRFALVSDPEKEFISEIRAKLRA